MVTPHPYQIDRKITEVFRERAFTLSAEILPPRNGASQSSVLSQVSTLIDAGAEFLSVTKGAGGSLRGGSLPIAQVIKESFHRPCIAHFTCRDLSREEVENSLIDHHFFGIRNILALRGDPPDGSFEWTPKENGHLYAYQLIEQIRNLNAGIYLERPGFKFEGSRERTDFCIGAATYPEFPDAQKRVEYFRLKAEAGASYGMSDMLFDAEIYARHLDELARAGITLPILPGTRILKSQKQAKRMMEKFKVSVPSALLESLPEEENAETSLQRGLEGLLSLTEKLQRYGAPGLHLFVISDTEGSRRALQELKPQYSNPAGVAK